MTANMIGFADRNQLGATPISTDSESVFATVLVCENNLLRRGLQHILSGTSFVLVEEVATLNSSLCEPFAQRPALFIIAASQDFKRTAEVIKQVKQEFPEARIVALADQFGLDMLLEGRKVGVDGFCLTETARDVLIKSLELVMLGEAVLPSKLVSSVLTKASPALKPESQTQRILAISSKISGPGAHKLSAREAEILGCLMDGAPNKVIARRLDVAEATIKVHVKAILRKIGAVNRTQAAMWATEHLPPKMDDSLRL